MRGTFVEPIIIFEYFRFIPAYAGNICRAHNHFRVFPVHPRVCGEHGYTHLLPQNQTGSSPRMRGTFMIYFWEVICKRFIPAYAGNILDHCDGIATNTVHPRVCGEHSCKFPLLNSIVGSSPRMRGTSSFLEEALLNSRFIPAYAGNIYLYSPLMYAHTVHPPRMRGTCWNHRV